MSKIPLTDEELAAVEELRSHQTALLQKDIEAIQQQHTGILINKMYGLLTMIRVNHKVGAEYMFDDDYTSIEPLKEDRK